MNTSDGDSSRLEHDFIRRFSECDRQLRIYIGSLLPNQDDADDVFQRVSIILWQKFDSFREDSSFLGWACGIAFYEVRNFLRVQSRNRLVFNDDLLASIADQRLRTIDRAGQRGHFLETCILRLPEADQSLVADCYSGEHTIKEVAENMRQSSEAIYSRIKRIREKLRRCIEGLTESANAS